MTNKYICIEGLRLEVENEGLYISVQNAATDELQEYRAFLGKEEALEVLEFLKYAL